MVDRNPRVSIGMPVYNGERLLSRALDSLLAQHFEDFELVISDNASQDATQEICLAYATKDRRIRYYRNETNIGSARNFNRVFKLTRGKYFKWAGHDDWFAPQLLSHSLSVLEQDPSLTLCYWLETMVDHQGNVLRAYTEAQSFCVDSPKPSKRFHQWLWSFRSGSRGDPLYGLIRSDHLKRTNLLSTVWKANCWLLAELSLLGPWRHEPNQLALRAYNGRATVRDTVAWLDPLREGRVGFPHWGLWWEYLSIVSRAPLSIAEKAWLEFEIMRYFTTKEGRGFVWDLKEAAKQLLSPGVSSPTS